MSPHDQSPPQSPPGPSTLIYSSAPGRWVIAAAVLGSGMAAIDGTVVGIALPSIGRQFHASVGALQWVITGYLLTLAALLLVGGSLGDHFGRRKIFTIGVVWFAVASAACGLATDSAMLTVTRILQGVGAALLVPGSLAILQASFAPQDRGRAIGAWTGLGGVATAAGPLLGGYLITAASWRWIFFINVPIAIVVVVLAVRHVPESRDPTATGRIDTTGALLAVVALSGLTSALIEGPTLGWTSPAVLLMAAAAIGATVAFVVVERSSSAPMLPLGLFRRRQFAGANGVTFMVYAALAGALFLVPVQLQVVNGYSPLESGVAMLPITVVMLALSARSGRLASRIGPRLQMSVGPIVVAGGLALLTRAGDGNSYVSAVLPGVVVLALGLAITVAPLTSTAMSAVASEHAGLASAVNNDVARLGGLVAVAILPSLAGITGTSYLHPSEFSTGFQTAMLISAGLCAVGGGVAALTIQNGNRHPRPVAPASVGGEQLHCALDAPSWGDPN